MKRKSTPETNVPGATTFEQLQNLQPAPEPVKEPSPQAVADTHKGTTPYNITKEVSYTLLSEVFEIDGDTQVYELPGVPYTPEVASLSMPHITPVPFMRYRSRNAYGLLAYDPEQNVVYTLGGFLHTASKNGELTKA